MTPTGPGRHCAACQKVVVDFTQQTDAELLAFFRQPNVGNVCGRFRAGQLQRPLQLLETTSTWRGWLGGFLTVGSLLAGSSVKAAAQTTSIRQLGAPKATNETAQQLTRPLSAVAEPTFQPTDTLVEVRGVVLDAERCEPLPGVAVVLKDTLLGTFTDAAGEFIIRLKPTVQPVQLLFQYVGFVSQGHTVALRGDKPHRLEVALETQVLGELLVSYRPPWPWHPRAFYQWGKFWLTRPFR
jgi:hypothetical protein